MKLWKKIFISASAALIVAVVGLGISTDKVQQVSAGTISTLDQWFDNGSQAIYPRSGTSEKVLVGATTSASSALLQTPSLQITGISGSTQCVQASSAGVISGTGTACGSGSGGGVTSFSFTNGGGFTGTVTNSTTTPTLALVLQNASTSQSGQLTSTDWNTFNGKQGAISLTTTGTSGAATFSGGTLNIPQYAGTTYSAGTGLTLTTGTFSVNTSQNIAKLSNLTSNGLIKTTSSNGTLATAVGDTDFQNPISLTTTGTSGASTFSGDTLNIPQYANTTYTASTGLTLTGTAFSVNTSQNISTLSNISTAGFLQATSGGVLSSAALTSGQVTTALGLTPIANITGLVTAGTNITLTGSGTSASPYVVNSTAGGSGTVTSVTSADANATVANTTTTPVITIVSAPKLSTGRTISISGDLSYTSPSFDGSGNVTAAGTLATVNTNTGSWGTATQSPQFTVNGKGLITAAANVTITPAVGSITGLGTGVATALGTNIGSAGAFVTNGGALGTPSSGTVTNLTGTAGINITGTAPAGSLTGTTLNSTVVTSSLTSVGTINTGAWQGTKIGAAYGGTAIDSSASTGVAQVSAGTWSISTALANGTLATTQASSDNSTKVATTAYVTTGISNAIAGVNPAVAVQAATTSASNTSGLTYNNGASGIGATFTGTNNTAITVDGYTFTAIGQRLLVKNDTQSPSGAFNGIYYVTQIQTAILPPILTRALDYDQSSDINNTGAIPVVNGTVNALTSWILTSTVNTVGTDPLTYSQFSNSPLAVVPLSLGGTGQTTANAAFNALSPMTTLGDIIYENATPISARLAGNTTATKKYLQQTGNGTISAAPTWSTIAASELTGGAALTEANDTNITMTLGGTPSTALLQAASMTLGWTGTLAVSRGGLGVGTLAAHGVLIGNGTSAVNVTGAGTAGQVLTSNGASADPTFQSPSGSPAPQILLNGAFSGSTSQFNDISVDAGGISSSDPVYVLESNGTGNFTLEYGYDSSTGNFYQINSSALPGGVASNTTPTGQGAVVNGKWYVYSNNTGNMYVVTPTTLATTVITASGWSPAVDPYFSDGTNLYQVTSGNAAKISISGTTLTFVSNISFTSMSSAFPVWSDGTSVYQIAGGVVTKWAITGGAVVSTQTRNMFNSLAPGASGTTGVGVLGIGGELYQVNFSHNASNYDNVYLEAAPKF